LWLTNSFWMRFFVFLILALSLMGCAKRGYITGGVKDTIPPVIKLSDPKNFSTSFTKKEIKIYFDEYVKLKDLNKQLIVSPPMKNAPDIGPSSATKILTIRIKDTLVPNTTYSFNFGQSIQDNNEGNPLSQFKYVFSTGTYIDSLQLSGTISDAFEKKPDNFVTVMLYDYSPTFTDSIVYKQVPRYVTNTLDSSAQFNLTNLKAGKYFLLALKDANSNNLFNPKTDKIAFVQDTVTIPSENTYKLTLFKEKNNFKALKPTQASGNRLLLGFEGDAANSRVSIAAGTENIPVITTPYPKKDSLQLWFKPLKADSLQVRIEKENYEKTFWIKYKTQKSDTLQLSAQQSGTLHFRETFTLNSTTPIQKMNPELIRLIRKDSTAVPFQTKYHEERQQILFEFDKDPLEKYTLFVHKGAVTDYLERSNDSLLYRFSTREHSEYGNLKLRLEGVKSFPFLVELLNNKGDIIATEYSQNKTEFDFNLLQPNMFTIRIIYDENKNGKWDTGSFLQRKQPEKVYYFPTEIDVRANWDVDQTLQLPEN
jgi:uncharacterized protein (DUF2141 family)